MCTCLAWHWARIISTDFSPEVLDAITKHVDTSESDEVNTTRGVGFGPAAGARTGSVGSDRRLSTAQFIKRKLSRWTADLYEINFWFLPSSFLICLTRFIYVLSKMLIIIVISDWRPVFHASINRIIDKFLVIINYLISTRLIITTQDESMFPTSAMISLLIFSYISIR